MTFKAVQLSTTCSGLDAPVITTETCSFFEHRTHNSRDGL